ncbi:MAG: DUF2079 domain-containing protein [Chloroflexota bacterium]
MILFSVFFSYQAIQLYYAFQTGFDLGVYNQVVWNTLNGRIFFYTSTGVPLLHLSNHADPILALLAPFYLIYNGPETLLVIQATLIGLAGLPVYWLAKDRLKSAFAGLCCLAAFLLFPGTEVVTLSDFHPPAMAFAFLMFAFYFLETKRAGWFLLFSVLAMACKEQIPLQVIFLGLYALVWQRNWRLGIGTVVLGAVWFVVVMYWVIPAFSVTGDHIFLDYYANFGSSPVEIVFTAITRPDLVLQTIWEPARLIYLRDLFVPFAFLSLLGLPALLVGTPSFAINILSANPAMHDASRGHYVADVTPWLVWGAVFGLIFIQRGLIRWWPKAHRVGTNSFALVLLSVALSWHVFYGFSPFIVDTPLEAVTPHDKIGQAVVQQIPTDVPISAQSRLYAHLSHRHIAYVYPTLTDVEYIFLDVTSDTTPFHPNNYYDDVSSLIAEGKFGILESREGYLLLKRGIDNQAFSDQFYSFARADIIQPENPMMAQFGDEIQLLGYDVIDEPRRQETQVRFYWQALKPIDRPLKLYPFFMNEQGEIIEDTQLRPMTTQIWYPPEKWQVGEHVVSQTLPWPLGDSWSLGVGVLAGDSWENWDQRLRVKLDTTAPGSRRFETNTWVRLATYQRQGRTLHKVVPNDADLIPPQVLEANFADQMKLFGYSLKEEADLLAVTLYWEALSPLGLDYTIFAHVIDEQGQPVAQHDGQPWWQVSIPTSTWQPGEKLKDRHDIPLPAQLPAGSYQIQIGVYYWQTLERLDVIEEGVPIGNFVTLGTVDLKQ